LICRLRWSGALLVCGLLAAFQAQALNADRLGVIYNLDEPQSAALAEYYVEHRAIPRHNLVAVHLGNLATVAPQVFASLREDALARLPGNVQSLALIMAKPIAVGCMSITTAFAAGYRADFCEPGCALTRTNPLFDTDSWLPADTVGWLPAMLIPAADAAVAQALIDRGIASDGTRPKASVYLISTDDSARNVRARTYDDVASAISGRMDVERQAGASGDLPAVMGYFTGALRVAELKRIRFLPGAIADHLTSSGGLIVGPNAQMPASDWLAQGATASYGTVSEPCNHPEKFPNIVVLMKHYLRGDSIIEAYWKSVSMPGQGLFIGEPLARPFATPRR
jgi:uncharacterized protein (TIGR03790 family)